MVNIDINSCIGCNKCVKDCPINNLTTIDRKASALGKCMLCGHCVAICPTNAVSIPEYEMTDVEEYCAETFLLKPANILNAIKFRRSIRDFKDIKVEKDKLNKLLQAGRYTETAGNSQDVRFIIVQDSLEELKKSVWESWRSFAVSLQEEKPAQAKEFLKRYDTYKNHSGKDFLFCNAPVLLVVVSDFLLDGGLASANIESIAVAEGLGVLFNGYMALAIEHSQLVKDYLEIGSKNIASCMLIGYPNVSYKRTAPRQQADILWK